MQATAPRIWVTGAHGLLGRFVVDAFRAHGHRVLSVVRVPSDASGADDELVWDLRTPMPEAAFVPPTAIAHLAAARPASFASADVERIAADNLAIDRHVFEFAASHGASVVYASGCSVYGSRAAVPVDEDAPCSPLGPYPAAKLASEALGASLASAGRIRFASLRISAPYGPGQTSRTVLTHFVRAALAGDDLGFHGSGSREQDFVHARDVAEAFVAAFAHGAVGVFNVAAGEPITMRALAERIVSLVPGCRSRVVASGQPDPQEGLRARYDVSRAERQLGWRPRIALVEGLREMVASTRERA